MSWIVPRYDQGHDRGGLTSCRCDMSVAVLFASPPLFPSTLPGFMTASRVLDSRQDPNCAEEVQLLLEKLDDDLVKAWRCLRNFSQLVNLGSQTERLIKPDVVHTTMAMVVYPLLAMKFRPGSPDELVRLSLLVFSYHAFLQWKDIKPLSGTLRMAYGQAVAAMLREGSVCLSPKLELWVLMVGAVSMLNVQTDTWLSTALRSCLAKCDVNTWEETQAVLKGVIWMPVLDEKDGKSVYHLLYLPRDKAAL